MASGKRSASPETSSRRTPLTVSSLASKPEDNCNDVLTFPQLDGSSMCWFNAMVTALFYSDGMRQFFLNNYSQIKNHLKDHPTILEILDDFLKNNYQRGQYNNANFYNKFTPEHVMLELMRTNDPVVSNNAYGMMSVGGNAMMFTPLFLQFMNVKWKTLIFVMFDVKHRNKEMYEIVISDKNKTLTQIASPVTNENRRTIDLMSVVKTIEGPNSEEYFNSVNSKRVSKMRFPVGCVDARIKRNVPNHTEVLMIHTHLNDNVPERFLFDNAVFKLDAMTMMNFNDLNCSMAHQIAGITCNSKKYLYNGWLSSRGRSNTNNDGAVHPPRRPCKLLIYEWNKLKGTFCINTDKCRLVEPTDASALSGELCYDTSRAGRMYLYVRDRKDDSEREVSPSQRMLKKLRKNELDDLGDLDINSQSFVDSLGAQWELSIPKPNTRKRTQKIPST